MKANISHCSMNDFLCPSLMCQVYRTASRKALFILTRSILLVYNYFQLNVAQCNVVTIAARYCKTSWRHLRLWCLDVDF